MTMAEMLVSRRARCGPCASDTQRAVEGGCVCRVGVLCLVSELLDVMTGTISACGDPWGGEDQSLSTQVVRIG